jgi:gas vesicle protein
MPNSIDSNDNLRTNDTGGNATSNLAYLLAGCGIGATLALLFAPKPGSELRSDISEITRKGYDETLELAHEMKDRSTELYDSLRESGQRVYDLAAAKLHLAERTLSETSGDVRGQVNAEVTPKSGTTSQTNVGDQPPIH